MKFAITMFIIVATALFGWWGVNKLTKKDPTEENHTAIEKAKRAMIREYEYRYATNTSRSFLTKKYSGVSTDRSSMLKDAQEGLQTLGSAEQDVAQLRQMAGVDQKGEKGTCYDWVVQDKVRILDIGESCLNGAPLLVFPSGSGNLIHAKVEVSTPPPGNHPITIPLTFQTGRPDVDIAKQQEDGTWNFKGDVFFVHNRQGERYIIKFTIL